MCWKVKMKVALLCSTLCDPMNYTVHGILQIRILEWVAFPFSRGSSQPRDWTQVSLIAIIFYQLSHKGSPRILEWVVYPFSSRSAQCRNQTGVSCIAGEFFTNWAMRKLLCVRLIVIFHLMILKMSRKNIFVSYMWTYI